MTQGVKQQNQYENDQERVNQILNQGVWLQEEVLKFMIFAHYNINVLTSRLQRRYYLNTFRTNKIFKEMPKFIGTRSPTQCRSQNQKLIKKHKNIKKIIKAYEISIGKSEFQRACLQHYSQLKTMQSARKKLKLIRTLQLVSVYTQTDFLSDRSSQEYQKIKVQQEQQQREVYQQMQFTALAAFSDLGQAILKRKSE